MPVGEVGEVVVTSFNADYPLIRFATGDLSAFMPGMSSCGRTNVRIKGWMGRADQTTKIKGLFVRPEQVAALVSSHKDIQRARIVATREGEMDVMTVKIETENNDTRRAMTGSNRVKSRRPRASTHPTAPRDNGLQINPTHNSPAIETRPTDLPHCCGSP